MNNACLTCQFWLRLLGVGDPEDTGTCRRYPPAPTQPTTKATDICGEWEARGYR